MQRLNLVLAQLNFCVGDIKGNVEKIKKTWKDYDHLGNIVVFPELSVSGYPPLDLLTRHQFIKDCHAAINELVSFSRDLNSLAVVGSPFYEDDLYNSLVVVGKGSILGVYYKKHLPNYSVFDERRYFKSGNKPLILRIKDFKVGFSICEDIWYPNGWEREYAKSGCECIVNISASPFYLRKFPHKERLLSTRSQDNLIYTVHLNLVGAQDDLVFDGRSAVFDPEGNLIARLKTFQEDVQVVTIFKERVVSKRLIDTRLREEGKVNIDTVNYEDGRDLKVFVGKLEESFGEEKELYSAITLAIKDYVYKNKFQKVVVGLSGGIDSALVACLAVDALGKENVVAVFMPSMFTSIESKEDTYALANNLDIKLLEFDIQDVYKTYRNTLNSVDFTIADENLQSRIRANILFYLSNRYGYLVLSTSNKSESAVGYSTIYGDMSGGYAPIKDLYKKWVYRLAIYRNSIKPDIPQRILEKAPSAELRPNQKDEDTLPPYSLLDQILELYIEENMDFEDIVNRGFDSDIVKKVIRMVRISEYKRKQAPPGPKLTKRALYGDWRFPITNNYKPY